MPEALPGLAAIAALAACWLLISLSLGYGYTVGPLLQLLAGAFDRVSFHLRFVGRVGLGFIGDAIRGLDNDIRHAFGVGIAATQDSFNYMVHWQAHLWHATTKALADLAEGTLGALQRTTAVTIPHWVTRRLASVAHRLNALEHQILALPHRAEIVVTKRITHVYRETIKAGHAAIAIPLPKLGRLERETDALAGRIGRLGRTIEADAAKLSRLNRATLATAAVGLVAVALARLGLGSLRCSNTGRAAKRLCGMDGGLLDSLLADTVVIFGTVSLVEFARGMQDGTGEIAGAVRAFWRA